jgi:hypothetical protein
MHLIKTSFHSSLYYSLHLKEYEYMEAGIAQSVQRLTTGWTTDGSEFECR